MKYFLTPTNHPDKPETPPVTFGWNWKLQQRKVETTRSWRGTRTDTNVNNSPQRTCREHQLEHQSCLKAIYRPTIYQNRLINYVHVLLIHSPSQWIWIKSSQSEVVLAVCPLIFSGALCLSTQHKSYCLNRIQTNWLLHVLHKEIEIFRAQTESDGSKKGLMAPLMYVNRCHLTPLCIWKDGQCSSLEGREASMRTPTLPPVDDSWSHTAEVRWEAWTSSAFIENGWLGEDE